MQTLTIETRRRTDWIDLTEAIRSAVRVAGMDNGVATVFVPHTTAGITINENADPDVVADMNAVLERLIPWEDNYRHAEENSAAHVKATLVGSSVRVPVENGALALGTWQGIFFCEFDGPRRRRVQVEVT